MAKKLGFLQDPIIINDPLDGTTFFWKNDKTTLFGYTKSRKLRYSSTSFSPTANKQLSDSAILNSAQKFLSENNILKDGSFQTQGVIFQERDSVGEGFKQTAREKAELYQVNVLPKVANYEILAPDSTEPASFLQINLDGSIYAFQVSFLPDLKQGSTEYKLKNFKEISDSLDQAVLIETRNQSSALTDLPENTVEKIEITKIEVAYLADSSNPTLFQPIFKLSGLATLSGLSLPSPAVLYLPAIFEN